VIAGNASPDPLEHVIHLVVHSHLLLGRLIDLPGSHQAISTLMIEMLGNRVKPTNPLECSLISKMIYDEQRPN
jgi:hypothetical protein